MEIGPVTLACEALRMDCVHYSAGNPLRFADLVPRSDFWERVQPFQIELYHDGKKLDVVLDKSDVLRTFVPMERSLERYVALGASAYVKNVQTLHDRLYAIVREIRQTCDTAVQAALVWASGATAGYGWHRDSGAVLVLQLEGRKRWNIRGPARDSRIVWSGALLGGDMLFVPKGWWHIAEPCGHTLHFTLGLNPYARKDADDHGERAG